MRTSSLVSHPSSAAVLHGSQPERRLLDTEFTRTTVQRILTGAQTVAELSRELDLAPRVIRNWKRLAEAGATTAVQAGEDVVPASHLREACAKIGELERALGRKAMEVEILRATHGANPDEPVFALDALKVDQAHRRVFVGEREVHLTRIEYRLLTTLVRHAGEVRTHDQLLNEVWGPPYVGHSHYVRIYVAQLRRKLEDDPTRPRYFLTQVGVGYRLADK